MRKRLAKLILCFIIVTTSYSIASSQEYSAHVWEWSDKDSSYTELRQLATVYVKPSKGAVQLNVSFKDKSGVLCIDSYLKLSYTDEETGESVYEVPGRSGDSEFVYVSRAGDLPYIFSVYLPELGDYKYKIFIDDNVGISNRPIR